MSTFFEQEKSQVKVKGIRIPKSRSTAFIFDVVVNQMTSKIFSLFAHQKGQIDKLDKNLKVNLTNIKDFLSVCSVFFSEHFYEK